MLAGLLYLFPKLKCCSFSILVTHDIPFCVKSLVLHNDYSRAFYYEQLIYHIFSEIVIFLLLQQSGIASVLSQHCRSFVAPAFSASITTLDTDILSLIDCCSKILILKIFFANPSPSKLCLPLHFRPESWNKKIQ